MGGWHFWLSQHLKTFIAIHNSILIKHYIAIFPLQWVYVLDIVHQVLGWCGLSAVDPALTAEVVLRLALVFEASAALDSGSDKKSKSGRRQQ